MDLFTLIKVVVSRWRVVLPLAVLTLGLAYFVQAGTPPTYEANGYLVLETPEASGEANTADAIDLEGMASGIQLQGDGEPRDFTVASMGGNNYSVSAAAPSAMQAEQDVDAVVDALAERIRTIQDDADVPDTGRLELSLVDPQVIAEQQADGSFLATASIFLNDPAASGENPYPPSSYTGRLLQVSVMGDSGLARFTELTGGGVSLSVASEARDAAPLLQVVTTGSDPQAVIDGFFSARDIIIEDLVARQERADLLPRQRTTISVVDAPMGVVDESPPLERLTAVVVALGGILALGVALVLDGWDRRAGPFEPLRDVIAPEPADLSWIGFEDREPEGMSNPPVSPTRGSSTTPAGR